MTPHTFAAAAFLAATFMTHPMAEGATAEPQRQQRSNMRFRAMDANGDGRISRAEWRGNDRSFRNHDWNGDGVLSGDEVLAGAQWQRNPPEEDGFYDWTAAGFRTLDQNRDNRITRSEWRYSPELFVRADRNRDNVLTRAEFLADDTTDLDREDRFDDLDTNNNGRIERAEWHGTAEAFDWLDRNNDGRLSRTETVGNDEPVGTSGRYVTRGDVTLVSARTRWTDTGLVVRAGDMLQIDATGTVTMSDANDIADPSGARSGRRAPSAPLPQMPAGGLIARIGDGAPFFIGDRDTLDRAASSGRLFLGVNDDELGDNDGQFRVTISVRRQ